MLQFFIEKGSIGLVFTILFAMVLATYYFTFRFVQSFMNILIIELNTKFALLWINMGSMAHELAHSTICNLLGCKIIESKSRFNWGEEPPHTTYEPNVWIRSTARVFVGIAPAILNIPLFIWISKFYLSFHGYSIYNIVNPLFVFGYKGLFIQVLFLLLISGVAPSYDDFKGMIKNFASSVLTVTFWYMLLAIFISFSTTLSGLLSSVLYLVLANLFYIEWIIVVFALYIIVGIIKTKRSGIPFRKMDIGRYINESFQTVFNNAMNITMNITDEVVNTNTTDTGLAPYQNVVYEQSHSNATEEDDEPVIIVDIDDYKDSRN